MSNGTFIEREYFIGVIFEICEPSSSHIHSRRKKNVKEISVISIENSCLGNHKSREILSCVYEDYFDSEKMNACDQ